MFPIPRIAHRLLLILLLIPYQLNAQVITSASYGTVVTSLTTASAGAVTGTTFAMPATSSVLISWTVVADGSAISVNLEGSQDNSIWFTVDSITTPATGALKNYGFSSLKFARISQVSRTGGTATTGTIVTSRAYGTSSTSGGNFSVTGRFLAGNGTLAAPSYSFTSSPATGWFRPSADTIQFSSAGVAGTLFSSPTIISMPAATTLGWSSGADPSGAGNDTTLVRTSAGLITTPGTFSATSGLSSGTAGFLSIAAKGFFDAASNGLWRLQRADAATGNVLKVDSLPTVTACGAGSPAVVAGSTPFFGAVTIGTTSVATCTITFNGTAFPSAPHCSGNVETTTAANTRAMGYSATATVLTIVPSAAWVDSSVVNWVCASAK